jgi:hypothetical protein
MTLLIVAGLFVVRLIALTMLVMFSPVGFVGYIFPSTAKYATDWWNQLFSYAFFAPVMIFIMGISLRIMTVMGTDSANAFSAAANANVGGRDASWVASAAFFTIPVTMLWMGIGLAKKSGGAMASTIVDNVQKGGKALAMKVSGANWAKKNIDAYAGARKKRAEEMDKKRLGSRLGDRANDAQDKLLAGLGSEKAQKRYDKRRDTKNKEDIKDATSNHDSTTEAKLYENIDNMDETSVAAMSDKDVIDAAGQVRQALSRGAKYEKEVENKIKVNADAAGFAVNAAVITATMTAGEIDIENKREKSEREARDKWVQSEKTKHMDQARAVIKAAEERGKLKQAASAPVVTGPPAPPSP